MPRRRLPGISAYKVGDWARAKIVLDRLIMFSPKVSAAIKVEAHQLKNEIHRGLWSSVYDRAFNWKPLSGTTKRFRQNIGNPTLIDTGDYVNAIRVISLGNPIIGSGRQVWGVGVSKSRRNRDGERIADIGLKHEFGTPKIPARPFWRHEYTRSRQRLYQVLLTLLRTQDLGLSTRQVRSLRGQLAKRLR